MNVCEGHREGSKKLKESHRKYSKTPSPLLGIFGMTKHRSTLAQGRGPAGQARAGRRAPHREALLRHGEAVRAEAPRGGVRLRDALPGEADRAPRDHAREGNLPENNLLVRAVGNYSSMSALNLS